MASEILSCHLDNLIGTWGKRYWSMRPAVINSSSLNNDPKRLPMMCNWPACFLLNRSKQGFKGQAAHLWILSIPEIGLKLSTVFRVPRSLAKANLNCLMRKLLSLVWWAVYKVTPHNLYKLVLALCMCGEGDRTCF